MSRIQSLAFPFRPADGEIVHRLLPPFAGKGGNERWPDEMLPIAQLRVSENGERIAMAAGSRVHLFDQAPDSGEVKRTKKFGADGTMLTSLALSADGRLAAATSAGGNLFAWDLERRTQLLRVELATSGRSCAFHEDWGGSPRLLVGEVSGTVRGFDLDEPDPIVVIPAQAAPVEHLLALRDGHVASAGPDGAVHVWDLGSPIQPTITVRHSERISDCAVLSDGNVLLTSGFDGMVGMWATGSGRLLGWYRESVPLYRLCALCDGQTAVTSTASSIHLLDLSEALAGETQRQVEMPPELSLERGPGQTPRTAIGLPLPRATGPSPAVAGASAAKARRDASGAGDAVASHAAALLAEEVGRGFSESPRTILAATAHVPVQPAGGSEREGAPTSVRTRDPMAPPQTPTPRGSGPLTDLGFDQDDIGPVPGGRGSVEIDAEWWPEEERGGPSPSLPNEAGSGLIAAAATQDFSPAFTIEASNYTPAPMSSVAPELVRPRGASESAAVPTSGALPPSAPLAGLELLIRPRDLAISGGAALAGTLLAFAALSLGGLVEGAGAALGASVGAGLALFGGFGLHFARRRLSDLGPPSAT